jgi:autotransporter translocation and assembly factor TamB
LPADRLELTAALSNTALDLNAKIGAATLGPLSEGDITLTASGPRNAIAFNLDISGQTEIANMNRPAILAVNGSADLTAQNMSLQTDIKAKLGRQVFTTNNPLIMTQIDGGWMTDVNMSLLGGVLKAELNSAQNLLSLRAQSLSLPSIRAIF